MSSAPMKGYVLEVFHDDMSTGPGGSAWVLAFETEAERDEAARDLAWLRFSRASEGAAVSLGDFRDRLQEAETLVREAAETGVLGGTWLAAARRFLQGDDNGG